MQRKKLLAFKHGKHPPACSHEGLKLIGCWRIVARSRSFGKTFSSCALDDRWLEVDSECPALQTANNLLPSSVPVEETLVKLMDLYELDGIISEFTLTVTPPILLMANPGIAHVRFARLTPADSFCWTFCGLISLVAVQERNALPVLAERVPLLAEVSKFCRLLPLESSWLCALINGGNV